LALFDCDRGAVMLEDLRRAETPWEAMRGLLGRPNLDDGEGLWISDCRCVHTFFMRFAIDVVFLDAGGRVCKIVPALAPWRAAWCGRAAAVVEMAAGVCGRWGLAVGATVAARRRAGALRLT